MTIIESHCPITRDCTVYTSGINHNELIGFTYRTLYCLQNNKKYVTCKRYQAFMKLGRQATRTVMPNSPISVEEIARLANSI